MLTELNFDNTINSSLQIGDTILYTEPPVLGITKEPIFAGIVSNIMRAQGKIIYNHTSVSAPPTSGSFILFKKDIRVNESSLKGYYADVTLVNRSTKRAELFAVSSGIAPSSK